MDEIIPQAGFFTPKRPVFRMTPPVPLCNFGKRYPPFLEEQEYKDQRRGYSQGYQRGYSDRFGRFHDMTRPGYRKGRENRDGDYEAFEKQNQGPVYPAKDEPIPPPPPPPFVDPPPQHQMFPHPGILGNPVMAAQMQALQGMDPRLLGRVSSDSCFAGTRFVENARVGLDQFKRDYTEEAIRSVGVEVDTETVRCPEFKLQGHEMGRGMGVGAPGGEFRHVRFDVDNRDFVDNREVVSFVGEGEREYKIFEDNRLNPVSQIIKEVYNVNSIDYMDAKEICGVKVLPQTLQKWPLDVIGANWEGLRRRIVNFSGGGSSGKIVGGGQLGSYGVEALAKAFVACQSGENVPLWYALFVGMNVDKVVKDLDGAKAVTPGFSGPLADRNLVFSGSSEVVIGVPEYDVPVEVEGACGPKRMEAYKWSLKQRITRRMFNNFSMDILFFIFYTITGDALQLLAAHKLYERGWRYHKIYQIWVSPYAVDENGEKKWTSGAFKYFHYGKWVYSKAEFKITEGVLEGEPGQIFDPLWE